MAARKEPAVEPDEQASSTVAEAGAQPVPPPQGPQVAINLTPQALLISVIPAQINIGLGDDAMNQLCRQWLASHPALADELLQQRVEQLRNVKKEMALITTIRRSSHD